VNFWTWLSPLLAGPVGAALVAGGLLTVRWTVFLLVVPLPPLAEIGFTLRVALAAALAAGSLPGSLPAPLALLAPGAVLGLAAKEALVGLLLGTVTAFLLAAFDAAGRLTDQFRGATMAEVFTGSSQESTSPLGAFLVLAVLALLAASGGLLVLLGGLVRAADAFPVASLPVRLLSPAGFPEAALGLFGRTLEVGFLLAAPAMAVSLLLDVSLGMAARAAPGFEGYFLALPVRAVLGLGALVVALQLLRPHLADLLRATLLVLAP
jgi:type III secretory pathway component EscT